MGAFTDFIARWVRTGYNFDLVICGGRGNGKSYASLALAVILAHMFGHRFTVENIHFKAKTLMQQINRLEAEGNLLPGMVFILDEAGCEGAADSQAWWDTEVKALAQEMETYRKYNLIVIFTTPMLSNVTKRSREMFHGYLKPDLPRINVRFELDEIKDNILRSEGVSKWIFHRLEAAPVPKKGTVNEMWRWRIKTRGRDAIGHEEGYLRTVKIKMPPVKLRNEYEKMKGEYLREKRTNKIGQMEEKEAEETGWTTEGAMREIKRNLGKFTKIHQKRRIIREGMVRDHFGFGKHKLKDIKDLVDYEYNIDKKRKVNEDDGQTGQDNAGNSGTEASD